MSDASWKRRIAAIPDAPAPRQSEAFSGVMPPMASTGMETARQTAPSRSSPCGATRATVRCKFRSFERVARNANQETLSGGFGVHKPLSF
jgi:hypothetical protein